LEKGEIVSNEKRGKKKLFKRLRGEREKKGELDLFGLTDKGDGPWGGERGEKESAE